MGLRRSGHFGALIEDEDEKKRKKIASDWTLAKWIVRFMFRDYKGLTIIVLILIGLGSIVDLISPLIIKFIIDNVLKNTTNSQEVLLFNLLILVILLLATIVVQAIITIFRTIILYKIGYKVGFFIFKL